MGYTHYWYNPKGPFNPILLEVIKGIVTRGISEGHLPEQVAEFGPNVIHFETGAATFRVDTSRAGEFDCCKTRRVPGDKYVVAVLLLLHICTGKSEMKVSSDGCEDEGEFAEACQLIYDALAPQADPANFAPVIVCAAKEISAKRAPR